MNRRILFIILPLAWLAFSTQAFAQWVPPRTYLKPYNGMWSVPLLYQSLSANFNPTDSARVVRPGVSFDADILQAGYSKAFALFDRAATVTALLPMGRVSSTGALNQDSRGFGDLLFEFNMHLNNARPLYNKPDQMRYEPGLSVNLVADLSVPTGEYDDDQIVNLGQNRWIGRVGTPIVWQLGPWVPGQRTTLEVIPSGFFFSDNNDYAPGDLETNPMFAVGAHLTRDLDEHFWVSLDFNYVTGGKSTVGGDSGDTLNVVSLGGTAAVALTDRLQLTVGYASTLDDNSSKDIQVDGFLFSLTYASARLWRGFERLEQGH